LFFVEKKRQVTVSLSGTAFLFHGTSFKFWHLEFTSSRELKFTLDISAGKRLLPSFSVWNTE